MITCQMTQVKSIHAPPELWSKLYIQRITPSGFAFPAKHIGTITHIDRIENGDVLYRVASPSGEIDHYPLDYEQTIVRENGMTLKRWFQ